MRPRGSPTGYGEPIDALPDGLQTDVTLLRERLDWRTDGLARTQLERLLAYINGTDLKCGQQPCSNPATREVLTNYGALGQLCDDHYAELEQTLSA